MRLVEKKQLGANGRIVIPSQLRHELALDEGQPIDVYQDGDQIVLRPHDRTCGCALCGRTRQLIEHDRDQFVCEPCARRLAGALDND